MAVPNLWTSMQLLRLGEYKKIVQEGRYYSCNRLQVEIGSRGRFGRILALKNDGKFYTGAPWMENASVEAEILDKYKGDKVIVFKMKPKKHTRSKNGHTQLMTR